MAQSVERRLGKAEATGSIPVSSLKIKGLEINFLSLLFFLFFTSKSNCKHIYYSSVYCEDFINVSMDYITI